MNANDRNGLPNIFYGFFGCYYIITVFGMK